MSRINPGKFDKRVEIWGKVKGINTLNQTTYEPDKLRSVWAQIIPQTGRLMNQPADTVLSNVTHKIIIRYSAYPELSPEMWLVYRGKRFDIDFILNPYENDETLEVFVRQVG